MADIIQHPRAEQLRLRAKIDAERSARKTAERAELADYRKHLKNTKAERDARRAWKRQRDALEDRIFGAVWRGALAARSIAENEAGLAILEAAAAAAEASAAKVAGYETWAELRSADENDDDEASANLA